MKNDLLLKLIFCKLMLLFNVDRIRILQMMDGRIDAVVGWPDEGQPHYDAEEEQQAVAWRPESHQLSPDVSICLDFLAQNDLLRGDRIKVDRPQLTLRLMNFCGWSVDRTELALECMLSIRVDMIDEGVATDAFFLHF